MKKRSSVLTIFISMIFASAAHASGPNQPTHLDCSDADDAFSSATLFSNPTLGLIAVLTDGYDGTRSPTQDGISGIPCNSQGEFTRCVGYWSFGGPAQANKQIAEAIFHVEANGTKSVSFNRSPLYGGGKVQLACVGVL